MTENEISQFDFLGKNLARKISDYIRRNDSSEIERYSKKIEEAKELFDKEFFSCIGTDKRIADCNISSGDISSKTFSTFEKTQESKQYFDIFCKWSPKNKCGIFFYGSYGTGKSHLMIATILKWHSDNFRCYYIAANKLFDILRDDSQQDYINKLMVPDLLVIDDLGTEYSTEYTQKKFLMFLEDRIRYRHVKINFISSNLSLTELQNIYDKRALDRLKGQMIFIESSGRTFRDNFYLKNKRNLEQL